MANNLLSYAGWYFLPNLVTGYAQSILYTIFIRAGDPKPAPGTPRYIRDRKRIHVAVIVLYLLYTVYEADWQLRQAGDFYSILGVTHDAGEKVINSKFRRLTLQYHPDKVSTPHPATESIYIALQTARDTLTSPPKHFAYDRLGPDILLWQHCKTLPDYVFHGLQQTALYYGVSFAVLVLLGMLGYLQQGKFWRYAVMAGLFCVEMSVLMSPEWPGVLAGVVNPVLVATGLRTPYLPYQMLTLLRKLSVTFFIALNQLALILALDPANPAASTGKSSSSGSDIPPQLLEKLDILARTTDAEISRLTGLELSPFLGERQRMRELREGLKEWLVQNTVRNDPEVKGAVGRTLARRRGEGSLSASAIEETPPPVPPHLE